VDHQAVGLRDAQASGWFNEQTAELCPGFAIAPTDVVADIGCGTGGKTEFCARFARKVIAIDIDATRVEDARTKLAALGKAEFAADVGTADSIPIESGTADKVICSEVLEHVDNPAQVLGELVRIGKPGALYLLTVPDARSEDVAKRVAIPAAFQKPYHIHIFTGDAFERLVADAGLIVQRHSYQGFYMAVAQALMWRSRRKGVAPVRPGVMDEWARTWATVLDLPRGLNCKRALDEVLPKSQVIVAVKP
jgi:SAM-dependent methyltransferase